MSRKTTNKKSDSRHSIPTWITIILTLLGLISGFLLNDGLTISRHYTADKFGWGSDFIVTVKDFDTTVYPHSNETFFVFIENRFNRQRYVDLNIRADKDTGQFRFVPLENQTLNNIRIEAGDQKLIKIRMQTMNVRDIDNKLLVSVEDSTNPKNAAPSNEQFRVSSPNS